MRWSQKENLIKFARNAKENEITMNWMGYGFGMGFLGFVTWLLVIIALILLILWLAKQISKR